MEWVNYLVLEGNKYYEFYKKYFLKGLGVIFIFGLKGGYSVVKKIINNVKFFLYFVNVGDVKLFIIYFVLIIY